MIGRSEFCSRSGIVVIVSDCYEAPDELGRAVDALRMRGHDVVLFHVVDPAERDLPFEAPSTFEDAETGMLLPLRPDALRAKYKAMFGEHRDAVEKRVIASGADYVRLDTDQPLDRALHFYLDRRMSSGRVR